MALYPPRSPTLEIKVIDRAELDGKVLMVCVMGDLNHDQLNTLGKDLTKFASRHNMCDVVLLPNTTIEFIGESEKKRRDDKALRYERLRLLDVLKQRSGGFLASLKDL